MATRPTIKVVSKPRVDPETGIVDIMIRVSPLPANGAVAYAAAPPADRRFSFAGSGLPFGSAKDALESSRASRGIAKVDIDGTFIAHLRNGMPGSYYAEGGTALVPPCVHVTYVDENKRRIRLVTLIGVESIPHRSLGFHPRRKIEGAAFYSDPLSHDVVRSQDQILKDSAWTTPVPGWSWTTAAFWKKSPRV